MFAIIITITMPVNHPFKDPTMMKGLTEDTKTFRHQRTCNYSWAELDSCYISTSDLPIKRNLQ